MQSNAQVALLAAATTSHGLFPKPDTLFELAEKYLSWLDAKEREQQVKPGVRQ